MKQTLMKIMGVALPLYAVIWYSIYKNVDGGDVVAEFASTSAVAVKCIAVACLLSLVVAIENVSRERLFSTAIDPLNGADTAYMKFAQRLLVSSLEQFIVFAVGLYALSTMIRDHRVIVTCTITWILSRFIFWFAYSKGPQYRAAGLFGMIQSYVVLAYVAWLVTPLAFAAFVVAVGAVTYRAWVRNHQSTQPS